MRKIVYLLILVFGLSTTLSAAAEATIHMRGGDIMKVQSLTSDSKGNLSFILKGTQYIMPVRMVDFASIPMPKDIIKADKLLAGKKYSEAAETFKLLSLKYRYLGWFMYCSSERVKALREIKGSDYIDVLKAMSTQEVEGPQSEINSWLEMCLALAEYYSTDKDKQKKTDELIDKVINGSDGSLAARAFNLRGDMLVKADLERKALLMYMRPLVIFSHSVKNREYSYYRVIGILRNMHDKRAEKFYKDLKKEYPESEYLKKLSTDK